MLLRSVSEAQSEPDRSRSGRPLQITQLQVLVLSWITTYGEISAYFKYDWNSVAKRQCEANPIQRREQKPTHQRSPA